MTAETATLITVEDIKPGINISHRTLDGYVEAYNGSLAGATCIGTRFANGVLAFHTVWGADLEHTSWSYVSACYLELNGANLQSARLYRCNLQEAQASGLQAAGAIFERVNLYEANLRGANLRNAQFIDCEFRFADLRAADIRGARFENCRLLEANLGGVNASEGTVFVNCDLAKVNWTGANITGAHFEGCAPEEGSFERTINRNRRRRRS